MTMAATTSSKKSPFPGLIHTETKPRSYPPLDDFVRDADTFLQQVRAPDINHFQFILDDIPFQVSKTQSEKGIHLCIWATLGYLPYSAESAEKRRALVYILESAHYLPMARIGVDKEMKIIARGDFLVKSIDLPNFIFLPLLAFWREAKPFVTLIGENL